MRKKGKQTQTGLHRVTHGPVGETVQEDKRSAERERRPAVCLGASTVSVLLLVPVHGGYQVSSPTELSQTLNNLQASPF